MSKEREPILPGFPEKPSEAIVIRDAIRTTVIELHRKMTPLVEILGSADSLSMKFKVGGDTMTVNLKPGKAEDR